MSRPFMPIGVWQVYHPSGGCSTEQPQPPSNPDPGTRAVCNSHPALPAVEAVRLPDGTVTWRELRRGDQEDS